jgi:hypothetical protein
MARDYKQIASNVATLVEKDAPDELINKYLGSQGLTFSQFKDVLEGPTLVGQAKEFVKGIPAGFIGTLGTAAEGAAALLPESLEKPVVEKTRKAVEALSPEVTPGYEDTVGRELGQAVGSIGSFLVPGTIGGKALGAVGMGTRAAGTLVGGGFGAAAGAGEARQRAEMEGATPEEKSKATALGMLPGALEALPTARLLRFMEPAKHAVSKIPEGITNKLLQKGADVLATAGIEGAQEWAQGLGQNMIAQGIYKPDQKLMEGLSKDAAYGAGAGAIAEVFLDMVLGKKGMTTRENLYNKLKTNPESVPTGAVGALEDIATTEDQARRAAFAAEQKAIELRAIQERGGYEGSQAYAELSTQVEALQEKARIANEKADAKKQAFQQSAFHEAQPDLLGDVLAPKEAAAPTVEPIPAPITPPGQLPLPLEAQQSLALNAPPQPVNLQQPAPVETPAVEGRPVTVEDIKAMGIGGGPNVGIKQAILGKDLTDPKQAAEVKAALETYAGGNRSAKIIAGVENFLNTAPFLEQQALNLRRPYGSMKKAGVETTPAIDEQAALQEELNAELGQEPQSLEDQNVGETTTPISGPSEPSVRVPSIGPEPTAGVGQPERRGMVPVGNVIGQPIGGEAPVQRALGQKPLTLEEKAAQVIAQRQAPKEAYNPDIQEPSAKLNARQAKEYREAIGNYLERANYIGAKALDYLAGDLHGGENLKDANRAYRGLSEDQKAYVDKQLKEFKKDSRRGLAFAKQDDINVARRKAFEGTLEEGPLTRREITRIPTGATTEALVAAVRRGDLAGALNEIAKDTSDTFNILEKLVSNRLLANKGSLPKIEIVPAGTIKDGAAQYNPFTDTVQINEGEVDSHTVLHETVHGFLHTLIERFESGASNKGIADLKNLYDFIKEKHPELANRYGMESLTEFASELMSNRDFQEELKNIPYRTENQSLFTAFVRAVLNALGLSPTQKLSALARGMMAAEQAIAQGRAVQEMRTGVETGPAVKLVRTDAENDLAAMGNITNEKAKAPEKGLLGKVTAFAMDPMYRQDVIDRFRTQVTYKGASVESKLKREYDNAIRDGLGELRPDVLALQAEHSDNLVSQAIMKGGLDIDKESGLWQAVKREQTLANTFKYIADLGERLGDQTLAYELANKTFIGKRAGGIQRDNEQKQKDADIAAAKGNKVAAQKLRDSTVYVHATAEQIAAAEAAYDKYPELQAAFKEFTDFKNGLIDTMVKAGRLTNEEAVDWKSKIDYVPWNRIKEYEDKIQASPKSYFKGLVNLGQLGRLSGSDDQINNVFDNMVGLSFWMGNTAIRNYAAVRMADALTKIDAQEIKPGMPITDPTKVIYVYKEGIPHVYQLGTAADVYAFKGIESVGGPMLEGFASLSNILRKGTTAMPAFAVSQLFQDSYRAMLLSGVKSPLKIPLNVLKNFGGELMGDDLSKHLASYGIIGAYDLVPNRAKDEIEKQLGIKRRGIAESILNKFEAFSLASDAAQRRAVYEQTFKETNDQALALYRAQEIINFKRQGANRTIGVLRQIIPFFNAYLQGMDVLARSMAGTGLSGKEKGEAIKLFAATAAKLTALSFIYAAMVAGDDEYEKLRGFERDKNFIIPGTGMKIPVAQEVGFLFKVVPERIYHYIVTQGTARPDDAKRTMIELRDGLLDAFGGPNLTPQAVKPALEVMVNRSFFTQSPIVGRGMENREAYLQFTNNTSEIAKLIGKATNTSPLKWDHFIKGYTGVAGGTALGMTDYLASNATGVDRPDRRVYELPQFRTFMYNKVGGGDKEDFYNLRDEVRRTVDTVNALKADGRIQELQDYIKDPDKFGLYMLKSSINGIEQRLEDIRKYKKIVSADPRMDGARKKDVLERFENTENALLQAFNLPRLTEFARSFG